MAERNVSYTILAPMVMAMIVDTAVFRSLASYKCWEGNANLGHFPLPSFRGALGHSATLPPPSFYQNDLFRACSGLLVFIFCVSPEYLLTCLVQLLLILLGLLPSSLYHNAPFSSFFKDCQGRLANLGSFLFTFSLKAAP